MYLNANIFPRLSFIHINVQFWIDSCFMCNSLKISEMQVNVLFDDLVVFGL